MTITNTSTGQHEEASSYVMGFVFHKLIIGALLIVYFLILSALYEKYISPIFGYRGFAFDRSPYKFGMALISIILVSGFINVNRKPSSMILFFYVMVMLIPQLSFTYNSNGYAQIAFLTTLGFFILFSFSQVSMKIVNVKNVSFVWFEKFIYVYIFAVMIYTVYRLGYDHFSFKIDDVYIRRAILEKRYDFVLSNTIGLCFIFITFMAIAKSKYFSWQLIIPLALGVLFFGLTGHKKFAIAPICCVVTYHFIALEPKYGFYAVLLSIIATGTYYLFTNFAYVNVLENYEALFFIMLFLRTLSIPAQLNDLYYDFFSQNGFLFWSYSKIGLGFFQYDFDWSPARLVGLHMFTNGNANTGMIGSGYMNAGTAGVVFYATIAGLTLAFVDRIAELRGNRALYTMLALPSFVIIFTSSDLPNIYFSQGFGVILLMMWLFRFDEAPPGQKRTKMPA